MGSIWSVKKEGIGFEPTQIKCTISGMVVVSEGTRSSKLKECQRSSHIEIASYSLFRNMFLRTTCE